jgi:hypothetical protein
MPSQCALASACLTRVWLWAAQVRAVIPRRTSLAGDRGVLIVSYSMHKQKTMFFFLLQVRRPHCPHRAYISALRSARLPVNLIGSPINYANRLISCPITSQSTGVHVLSPRAEG